MGKMDEVHVVEFSVANICPDCRVEVIVDSINYKVRYIQNGIAVPYGVYVNVYGICPKCQGAVALVWDKNNLPPLTPHDIGGYDLQKLLKVYASYFLKRVAEACPDKKKAN